MFNHMKYHCYSYGTCMYHQNRPQPQLYFSMNVRTYQLFSARLPTPYPHPLLTHSLIYYFDFLIFCFFLSQPREFFTISILFFFFLQNCIQMFSLLFEMVHLTFLMVCILNDKEIISPHFPVYTSMPMSFHITTKASIFPIVLHFPSQQQIFVATFLD